MENMLEQKVDIKIEIKRAQKPGKNICLVEFEKIDDKDIMRNKYKLKDYRIYISKDMSTKGQEKRKEIRKRAQEERRKDKTVQLGYN